MLYKYKLQTSGVFKLVEEYIYMKSTLPRVSCRITALGIPCMGLLKWSIALFECVWLYGCETVTIELLQQPDVSVTLDVRGHSAVTQPWPGLDVFSSVVRYCDELDFKVMISAAYIGKTDETQWEVGQLFTCTSYVYIFVCVCIHVCMYVYMCIVSSQVINMFDIHTFDFHHICIHPTRICKIAVLHK